MFASPSSEPYWGGWWVLRRWWGNKRRVWGAEIGPCGPISEKPRLKIFEAPSKVGGYKTESDKIVRSGRRLIKVIDAIDHIEVVGP